MKYHVILLNVRYLFDRIKNTDNGEIENYLNGSIKISNVLRDNGRAKRIIDGLIFEYGNNRNMKQQLIIGYCIALVSSLIDGYVSESKNEFIFFNNSKRKLIEPALIYINKNFTKKLSLKNISNRCMLDDVYFSHVFKETMHITVSDYINNLRVNLAEDLLLTTDKKISEISNLCGIDDPCYFSRWFKKNTGKLAQSFRKKEVTK